MTAALAAVLPDADQVDQVAVGEAEGGQVGPAALVQGLQGRRPEEHPRPDVPAVQNKSWIRNPIDAFVLARLECEGLSPSPTASRDALLRRFSLDLIGLPPTLPSRAATMSSTCCWTALLTSSTRTSGGGGTKPAIAVIP